MSNMTVMSCGSNEFGQLGLVGQAVGLEGKDANGGNEKELSPVTIDQQHLENVVYVAAGRFHTVAIRKQSEGD